LRALLEAAAVEAKHAAEHRNAGVRVSRRADRCQGHVLRGGAAERAGVAAGDEILAVHCWRLRRLDDAVRLMEPETPTPLLVSRDQRVLTLTASLPNSAVDIGAPVALKPAAKPTSEALARYKAWLSG
jgi:predicted metalloprotease with PDZ domain